ncbi:MAG: 1,2-phenylacetyl-CoA epoxidase subunit B [Bacteroidota bacterium]|nr:MAG: 1,2-phenylacetyl-CoA epoxidase subunit B [Bacteroidota bacterium]
MITDTQLDLWEVFIQNKAGSHVHAGSVHASDGDMALHNARDIYTRRQEGQYLGDSIEVCCGFKSGRCRYVFDPSNDKIYRHPTFYVMPEGAQQI